MMQPDFRPIRTMFRERRHEFLQADGIYRQCGGPRFCRECERERAAAREKRARMKAERAANNPQASEVPY